MGQRSISGTRVRKLLWHLTTRGKSDSIPSLYNSLVKCLTTFLSISHICCMHKHNYILYIHVICFTQILTIWVSNNYWMYSNLWVYLLSRYWPLFTNNGGRNRRGKKGGGGGGGRGRGGPIVKRILMLSLHNSWANTAKFTYFPFQRAMRGGGS